MLTPEGRGRLLEIIDLEYDKIEGLHTNPEWLDMFKAISVESIGDINKIPTELMKPFLYTLNFLVHAEGRVPYDMIIVVMQMSYIITYVVAKELRARNLIS